MSHDSQYGYDTHGYDTPGYDTPGYDTQGHGAQGYDPAHVPPAPTPWQQPPNPQGYPQPYVQQTYGYPAPYQPYGYPALLPDHPSATTVLVLGILGLVFNGLTAPFAWGIGNRARAEVRENPGLYKPGGSLTVGWVLGIIGTCYLILCALVIIAYVIFFVVAVNTSAS